ncbi:hypothetical protein [Flavobacterium psychrophilum]|nr:hypothetical protein [Flavobacterium psychrophilum]
MRGKIFTIVVTRVDSALNHNYCIGLTKSDKATLKGVDWSD